MGRASIALGAGRGRAGDAIDHGAGVLVTACVGDRVAAGDPILHLLYNSGGSVDRARALAEQAITLDDAPPARRPLVIDICQ